MFLDTAWVSSSLLHVVVNNGKGCNIHRAKLITLCLLSLSRMCARNNMTVNQCGGDEKQISVISNGQCLTSWHKNDGLCNAAFGCVNRGVIVNSSNHSCRNSIIMEHEANSMALDNQFTWPLRNCD